ncbi:glycoside hydrolase superfamily [Obelidium mucronatum]|nr:glycoside hydrolase superfamily [Obelidium mucronatum]
MWIPIAILAPLASALAKLEPPTGKLVFGAWLDTSNGPVSGGDSHASFNKRIGFNTGAFQLWQMLPPRPAVEGPPDYDLSNHNPDGTVNLDILNEGTNASIFLTVYPTGISNITDAHLTDLANQCNTITKQTKRDLFVRFAPEMNGYWFVYGEKPTEFVSLWKRAYTILNRIAPQVAMVWSPNYNGPPNKMPYESYWPGPEYVDWVGISVYWKGSIFDYPWVQNKRAPSDYAAQLIDATGPEGGPISFYKEYAEKYNKPLVISESASTFHVGVFDPTTGNSKALDVGVGKVETIMSFWNGFLFNSTFLQTYPLLKMIFCFEMYKVEDNFTQNDYRATIDPDTLTAFVAGLKKLDATGVVVWAQIPASSTTTSAQSSPTNSVVATASTPAAKSAAVNQCSKIAGIAAVILSICL